MTSDSVYLLAARTHTNISLSVFPRYVLPLTVISYLYVRVSRELEVQEGPLAMMMCDGRTQDDRPRTDSSCQGFR